MTTDPTPDASASTASPALSGPAPGPDAALVDLGGRSPWSILPPLCLGFFVIMLNQDIQRFVFGNWG